MANYFWNSDPLPPVGPPSPGPGGVPPGGVNHGPRWVGQPFRIGGQYGVPPGMQATQDWLTGAAGNASGGAVNGAGAGWHVSGQHAPLTMPPRGATGTGGTNLGPGTYFPPGPTGPPVPAPGTVPGSIPGAPPWWQAFQQYAGQRFPWLRWMQGNSAGSESTNPPAYLGPPIPGGTGTPGGGFSYPRGIY